MAAAQQGHRNYAKRQRTWFRREPDVTWLEGFGSDPEIRKRANALITERFRE
jgi:tRNA dimethylallyltransferase